MGNRLLREFTGGKRNKNYHCNRLVAGGQKSACMSKSKKLSEGPSMFLLAWGDDGSLMVQNSTSI